jgi:hypothetical protein
VKAACSDHARDWLLLAYSVEKLASAVDGKNLRSLREFPTKGAEGVHRRNVRLTQVVWLRLIATIEPIVGVIGSIDEKRPATSE